jgi:dTDP-4-amino-4,6-dideoxygalactose transaminase
MIPFNRPYMTGKELGYIAQAHFNSKLAGDGPFTKRCHDWLRQQTGVSSALLTHSCTSALEMAALLSDLEKGDEVIMPSYTFVSTANAFVLRGAVPVFVDIRADTMNIDESLIEAAITARTRAIVVVHYAGVACEMDAVLEVAKRHGLLVIEDAAQGVMSTYKGRQLGSIGDFSAYSFHETKNIISGEGGALLVKDEKLVQRAEILREKGTNRSRFFRGEVDKYTWVDVGSSYLPGEITAAFLWAQLEHAREITEQRKVLWEGYHRRLVDAEVQGLLRRPVVPEQCGHNAHLYYVVLPQSAVRQDVLSRMKSAGVHAVFHYVPLHNSPAGQQFTRCSGDLHATESMAERLIRLPLWIGLSDGEQDEVVDVLLQSISAVRDAS